MKIYYFSATGNSLYVAKRICEEVKTGEVISIPTILDENESIALEDDVIGFIYPIHCGSVPIVVESFLKKLSSIKASYIFAVGVTGGGGADLSFKHINKILLDKAKLSNHFTVKYISNYIRAGRNVTEERVNESMRGNEPVIYDISQSILKRDKRDIGSNLGADFLMYKMWRDYFKNKDKGFNVNENCIACNLCKEVCPVSNIDLEDGKPVWKGNCTDCMACINLCPKSAINIGKKTIKKNRYKNPKINVVELKSV